MSKDKKIKQMKAFMPKFKGLPFPPMPLMVPFPVPFAPKAEEPKEDKNDVTVLVWMDDCDSNMKVFWKQMIDMQKSSIDSFKEQWQQFLDNYMEMQDSFTESLPEEFPEFFGYSVAPYSPKELMEKIKKFQEMSREHFTEGADSFADFYIQTQEQTCDIAEDVVDKASEVRKEISEEEVVVEEEVQPEPSKKKSSSKKKAAKPKEEEAEPEKEEEVKF